MWFAYLTRTSFLLGAVMRAIDVCNDFTSSDRLVSLETQHPTVQDTSRLWPCWYDAITGVQSWRL